MQTMELVSIRSSINSITAYRLDTKERKVWQGIHYKDFIVQGEIFEIQPEKEWVFGNTSFVKGKIVSQRIDIPALELEPLPVHRYHSNSKEYEMEQVIPGSDDDCEIDPIIESVEYKQAGLYDQAWEILLKTVKEDLRCIDGHVHMGNTTFGDGLHDYITKIALKHYTVGVELGNYFLGDNFSGKLPWGYIDNRPYLRALHGQCLCYWALNRFEEAEKIATTLLKLNKFDNQGVRFILPDIKKKLPYKDFKE